MKDIPLEIAINYVAGAYIGIWVIFFGYLVFMGNKIAGMRREIDALTDAVERNNKKKTEAEHANVSRS